MAIEQGRNSQDERIQYQLGLQASQIQNVFAGHGLSTTVVRGSASRRFFHFDLRSHVNGSLQHLRGLKDELKKALGVESVRLLNEAGDLQLQVIRPHEPAVPLLDLLDLLPTVPPCTAVLGLTEDGAPVFHDFSAESLPNILISGQASAGKTVLLRTIAASLAINSSQAHVQLVAVNPVSRAQQSQKNQDTSLRPLNYLPHIMTDVAVRQTEITDLMLFLVREMKFRMEHDFAMPRIVVLIDQAATVMEHGGRTVVEAANRLAQQGADAGIHLVLSTSRPDAAVFGPNLKTNLQAHFVGRLHKPSSISDDVDPTNVEAESLLGEGDFLARVRSRSIRFQAAFINDYDLHLSLFRLYRNRPILLAKPLSSRVKLEQKSTMHQAHTQQFAFDDALVSAV